MKDGRLCVMQVISNLGIGGAQEVVRTLAENLELTGCRSVVAAFEDGPLRAEIEKLGITVEILPRRKHGVTAPLGLLLDLLHIRRALLALVRKHGVDVIQTHLLRSLDFLVLSLRWQAGVQVHWTFHNARFELREEHLARHRWLFQPKRWGYRALYSLGARGVDRLIAVSDEVQASILANLPAIPREKIAAISNSVDVRRYGQREGRNALRRELGLEPADTAAVVVATFKEQKGHRFLLEALIDLIEPFPHLKVLLAGDGELRTALQTRTRELRLENHVLFLGNRGDIPALLAASDLFILPSLWEGLPMALIEAMASGLPVVATQVSGTSQVMVHGETGLLVQPGDPVELAQAIRQVLSDPGLAAQMGQAARRRVEQHFGARRQALEYIDLFTQNSRPPSTGMTLQGDDV